VGDNTKDVLFELKTPETLPLNVTPPIRVSVTFAFVPLLNVQNTFDVGVGSVNDTDVPDMIR
jgi:hypothetical protein